MARRQQTIRFDLVHRSTVWAILQAWEIETCSCVQRFVMNISLGYFTYDMLCCLVIDLDFANVAHHLCTMLGLAVGVCNGVVRLPVKYISGFSIPTRYVPAERNRIDILPSAYGGLKSIPTWTLSVEGEPSHSLSVFHLFARLLPTCWRVSMWPEPVLQHLGDGAQGSAL